MVEERTVARIVVVSWLLATSAACLLQWWIILALLLTLLILFIVWTAYEGFYYQVRMGAQLRYDLGFDHGTRYVGRFSEVLTIGSVTAGGLFDQAGFYENDVIVDDLSITGLYKMLERARGGEPVTITVASCIEGRPLNDQPIRRLAVNVPPHG